MQDLAARIKAATKERMSGEFGWSRFLFRRLAEHLIASWKSLRGTR